MQLTNGSYDTEKTNGNALSNGFLTRSEQLGSRTAGRVDGRRMHAHRRPLGFEKFIVTLKYPANRKINGCCSPGAFCLRDVRRRFETHSALGHRFFDIPICIFSFSLTACGLDKNVGVRPAFSLQFVFVSDFPWFSAKLSPSLGQNAVC